MISYIIPVYNAENTIGVLLEDICICGLDGREIICVDDGSTDKTKDVIRILSEKYKQIKYFYQENAGVSAARNRGIREASGEYITFADSDDGYYDNYNEEEFKTKADLFVYGYRECLEDNRIIDHINENGNLLHSNQYICDYCSAQNTLFFNSCWNKVYKKDIILQSGLFDEGIRLGEDAVFNFNYLKKCRYITVYSQIKYIYNNYSESSLSRGNEQISRTIECYTKICQKLEELCDYYSCEKVWKKLFITYNFAIINELVKYKIVSLYDIRCLINWIKDKNTQDKFKRIHLSNGKKNKILLFCLKNKLCSFVLLYIYLKRIKKMIIR